MDDRAGVREPLLMQVEHLARQFSNFCCSPTSEPLSYHFVPLDVAEVTRDSLQFLQPIAEEAHVSLSLVVSDEAVMWHADRGALFTLLKNLMENAIQHAPAESDVRTEITAGCITVRDYGPGVTQDAAIAVFTFLARCAPAG